MCNSPSPLLSLVEAAEREIERVRQPIWADPMDHLKISIVDDGQLGLWLRLYSPINTVCNGRDPVEMIHAISRIDIHAKGFEAYTGPLPDSDEYKAAVAEREASWKRLGGGPNV